MNCLLLEKEDILNSAINGANKKLGLGYLLGFAGKRRWLLYLGCALSAVAMLLTFGPYICIWLVARDLIAVAPDWAAAENLALYGWLAFWLALANIVLYFFALLCTHACASKYPSCTFMR